MLSDHFHTLEELTNPDIRWKYFAIIDETGKQHRCSLQVWHKKISELKCPVILTQEQEQRLNEIKNLLLYSWFVYSFASTAFISSVLFVEYYMRDNNILHEQERLGAYIKTKIQKKENITDEYKNRLSGLLSLRNRIAHGDGLLHTPNAMLMSVQSSLDIVGYIADFHNKLTTVD